MTAVILDDPPRDGKSQSHPGCFRREKWIKYMVTVFGIYSGSGVFDNKRDGRVTLLSRYQPKSLCGCGTSGHCFDRILDQIQDYLLKLGAVGHYSRKVFLKFG